MKEKRDRNCRLVEYKSKHPEMSNRAIGRIFRVSGEMVRVVLTREAKRKQVANSLQ